MNPCPWCDGACQGADLAPLLTHDLAWLWECVAARADRTGDPHLTAGTLTVTAPPEVAARAAATGLLGGRALLAGQRRSVDLAELSGRLRVRGPHLTPGAVAAHAVRHELGVRVQARTTKNALTQRLRSHLSDLLAQLPAHVAELAGPNPLERLLRTGAVTRLAGVELPDALVDQAAAVLQQLPIRPARVDRRTLVGADPHALDAGPLAWLVLAVTGRTGVRPARAAWDQLGVDIDTLTGGLLVTGVLPHGWQTPTGAVLTLPPRELAEITWAPAPRSGSIVWVTENPSVLQAVADAHPGIAVACLNGTPSATVLAALGHLPGAGWEVRVRADFDARGLQHVAAMLEACPAATPWRMSAGDYRAHLTNDGVRLPVPLPPTDWDPSLGVAMEEHGVAVFEEDLLSELLADVPGPISSLEDSGLSAPMDARPLTQSDEVDRT